MELPAPCVAAAKIAEQQEGCLSANIAYGRPLLLLEPFFTIQESTCGSGLKQCGISQTKNMAPMLWVFKEFWVGGVIIPRGEGCISLEELWEGQGETTCLGLSK